MRQSRRRTKSRVQDLVQHKLLYAVHSWSPTLPPHISWDQFKTVADSISAPQYDESLVISELLASNNICKFLLGTGNDKLLVLAEAYLEASCSISQVLSQHMNLDDNQEASAIPRCQDFGLNIAGAQVPSPGFLPSPLTYYTRGGSRGNCRGVTGSARAGPKPP